MTANQRARAAVDKWFTPKARLISFALGESNGVKSLTVVSVTKTVTTYGITNKEALDDMKSLYHDEGSTW